ncbi:MAG: lysophospholipid acyltransferase family protein [bacterium]
MRSNYSAHQIPQKTRKDKEIKRRIRRKIVRNRLFIGFSSFIFTLILYLIGLTLRLKVVGEERVDEFRQKGQRLIYCLWHSRILLTAYRLRHRGINVIVSPSRDGEYISRILKLTGSCPIRGSSSRGGLRAAAQLIKQMSAGWDGAITPDGPQGPPEQVQPGIIKIAQHSGALIIPLTYEAQPKITLKSWDRFIIPYPFSRGIFIYGEPITVPPKLTKAQLEELRERLEHEMAKIEGISKEYLTLSQPKHR